MLGAAESAAAHGRGPGRWWIYQRERFPIVAHGLIIAAFSSSAVSYSALARGARSFPRPSILIAAFLSSFFFFLLLRICDEFKDAEEDALYRPYRPVPRGLVTLRELGQLAVACGLIQALLAAWLMPKLLIYLVLAWAWLALMSREFFASEWLRKRPVHYLWSHMLILPVIDFYLSAWDWAPFGHPPAGLAWLLGVSFLNGVVVEIGRKIRVPADEEPGVETYSVLWGRQKAIAVWLAAMVTTALLAFAAARRIEFEKPVAIVSGVLLVLIVGCACWFLQSPEKGRGKLIETAAGLWTLILYTSLGLAPMGYRAWGGL